MVITGTWSETATENVATINFGKTVSEINAYVNDGKIVVLHIPNKVYEVGEVGEELEVSTNEDYWLINSTRIPYYEGEVDPETPASAAVETPDGIYSLSITDEDATIYASYNLSTASWT